MVASVLNPAVVKGTPQFLALSMGTVTDGGETEPGLEAWLAWCWHMGRKHSINIQKQNFHAKLSTVPGRAEACQCPLVSGCRTDCAPSQPSGALLLWWGDWGGEPSTHNTHTTHTHNTLTTQATPVSREPPSSHTHSTHTHTHTMKMCPYSLPLPKCSAHQMDLKHTVGMMKPNQQVRSVSSSV